MLCDRLGISERRACRFIGQHRSTQRHEPKRATDDQALRARLRAFSAERPRWGYRQAHHRLREEGWAVNRKRVQRLWREEGLRVPRRARKRQRLGDSTVPARRLRAERPNHVWALDFQADQTADGRMLRLLNVVDEFTREALAMLVERSIDADKTVSVLEEVLRDDPVEARVVERERLVDAMDPRVAAAGAGGADRVLGAVDSDVVGEVVAEPRGPAADVEDPIGRCEVARDVAEVAGLLVPVEVAARVLRLGRGVLAAGVDPEIAVASSAGNDREPVVGEEEPQALGRERSAQLRVVPDAAAGVGRKRQHGAVGPHDAAQLGRPGRGVLRALQRPRDDQGVDGAVGMGERERRRRVVDDERRLEPELSREVGSGHQLPGRSSTATVCSIGLTA